MQLKALSLNALPDLDYGKIDEAFSTQLRRIAMDCLDRPAEDKPREVCLKIQVKPITESDGTANEVAIQMQVTSKVPSLRSKVYSMGLHKNGQFSFNPDSPDNVNQQTFLGDDES